MESYRKQGYSKPLLKIKPDDVLENARAEASRGVIRSNTEMARSNEQIKHKKKQARTERIKAYKEQKASTPANLKAARLVLAAVLAAGAGGAIAAEKAQERATKPANIVRKHMQPNVNIENPYEVKPGDSYWELAEKITGGVGATQEVVNAIKQANDNEQLHPGDKLEIPGLPKSE